MKFQKIVTLLFLLLPVLSCQKITTPDLDVKEAILHTPNGKLEFKRDPTRKTSKLFIIDGEIFYALWLFPLNGKQTLRIVMFEFPEGARVKPIIPVQFKHDDAYYQLNDGERIKLEIKPGSYQSIITPPPTMDYYIQREGIKVTRRVQKLTYEHKKKVKKEIYHYYIPFTIEGKEYAIDTTFRLKFGSTRRFTVPGTP